MDTAGKWFTVLLLGSALALSACGGGGSSSGNNDTAGEQENLVDVADVIDTETTQALSQALAEDPLVDSVTSRVAGIVVDDDPDSPVSTSLIFSPGGTAERIDFYGPKPDSGLPADYALVKLRDDELAIRVEMDEFNRPASAVIPDSGELQFRYVSGALQIEHMGIDGEVASVELPLPHNPPTALLSSNVFATSSTAVVAASLADRARPPQTVPDSSISVRRGVRVDVLLDGLSELPSGLAPFVRVTDCVRPPNIGCEYWLNNNGNFWSIGIIHNADLLANLDEVPPDWPDVATCEAARAPLAAWIGGFVATTGVPAVAPAAIEGIPALSAFLSKLGLPAGAAVNPAAVGTALTAGAVAAVFYTLGLEIGEFFAGEVDCSTVIRRAGIVQGFQAGLADESFSVEICFPAVTGVAYQQRCQSVGPYAPFNGESELGSLTFNATEEIAPLTVTSISITEGRAGEPVGAAVTVAGGVPPYTYTWNAPDAQTPGGDTVSEDGAASFIFPAGGLHPVSVTIVDSSDQMVVGEVTARIELLADVTGTGGVSASSVYANDPQFNAAKAVDGFTSTSWFSAGSNAEAASVLTWARTTDIDIGSIEIVGNGSHSTVSFRTGFGFSSVTAQVFNSSGGLVWEDSRPLPGTPDPTVTFTPDVEGNTVTLIFGGHEDANCGGFSELTVSAWQTPQS